jgi:hypothetical protein|tara:strand:+ start:1005 stop:2153 length:1149 start_codon:yes stop_codon:yes gene_type:complete
MEFTVKAVDANVEEKSRAQVEETLLKQHEEQFEPKVAEDKSIEKVDLRTEINSPSEEKLVEETNSEESVPEFTDTDVLSYIKKRYNKDINSVDELFAEKEANEDLPEDVSKYLKYKQETGRGINDFYKLQKDIDSMEDNAILANYYESTEDGLDSEDIQDIISDKFSFDEDLDDEKDIRKIKLAKKRELSKAKKFLNEQKDKYKVPLESSGDGLSEDQVDDLDAYKKYIEESKSIEELNKKRYNYFLDKTESVFNNEFKGFEFSVGDKNISFKPGDAQELKNVQSDVNNFVNKFMDNDGLINDPVGYHKAFSVAMNPDKFAKHFYEQGVAATVDNVSRKSKNINMDVRQQSQSVSKNGITIRPMGSSSDSGRGLKIRSRKNN